MDDRDHLRYNCIQVKEIRGKKVQHTLNVLINDIGANICNNLKRLRLDQTNFKNRGLIPRQEKRDRLFN